MPIYLYRCVNKCGTEVEKITTSASTGAPAQVIARCKVCGGQTRFLRAPTAAAIQTPRTHRKAQIADSHRKNPHWKENVIAGKTADGRTPTNLQQRSAEAWGSAFSASHGQSLDDTRKNRR